MILRTVPSFDAAEVMPRLWVGGIDAARGSPQFEPRFTLLVLCARELQPRLPFQGDILRPAFDDHNPIDPDSVVRAIEAGQAVAKHLKRRSLHGGRVLVTCAAGLNRSALVAGIAIKELNPSWSADRIVMQIRKMRSPDAALCNPYFCSVLQMYAGKGA
jgi:hypothetical protein